MTNTEDGIPEKYALDNARDEAQVRMAGLSAVYDDTTKRHLQRTGNYTRMALPRGRSRQSVNPDVDGGAGGTRRIRPRH